jgi:hypothetical protein
MISSPSSLSTVFKGGLRPLFHCRTRSPSLLCAPRLLHAVHAGLNRGPISLRFRRQGLLTGRVDQEAIMRTIGLAMLSAATLLGSCTAGDGDPRSAAASGRQCFFPSQVTGYTDAGRDRIYVHTGPRDIYLFETAGRCPEIEYSEAIAFDHRGSATICSGIDVTLIVPQTVGTFRCPVRMIRKLSDQEAEAAD